MDKTTYYDGTKLLSLLDINKNKPEIIFATSNRSAGKTTYFNRLLVNRYLKGQGLFMLLYRYKYELTDVADKFFKDIQHLFFSDYEMSSKTKASGLYTELYLNEKICGYAVAINSADNLKKYSHLFSGVTAMLFDEFQCENQSGYCANEVNKFISIHTSVARGNGEQSRYVPVYMLSNKVSLLNPYYTQLGITERLQSNTVFLRGNGYVLEQSYNASASQAQQESAFIQAFSTNDYVQYSSGKEYLVNDNAFIEKLTGVNKYVCTIRYNKVNYAIRHFTDENYFYCDNSVDETFPLKIAVNVDSHGDNYVLSPAFAMLTVTLRKAFESGNFRFKNLLAKQAIINLIKY